MKMSAAGLITNAKLSVWWYLKVQPYYIRSVIPRFIPALRAGFTH